MLAISDFLRYNASSYSINEIGGPRPRSPSAISPALAAVRSYVLSPFVNKSTGQPDQALYFAGVS